jgi:hypothetical protein
MYTNQAYDYILSAKIKPRPGIPYAIYSCGCIVANDIDPKKQYRGTAERICPYCAPKKHKDQNIIVTTFKLCQCGRPQSGKNIKQSKRCRSCHGVSKKTIKEKNKRTVLEYFPPPGQREPIGAKTLADAIKNDVSCIPCSNLFTFRREFFESNI